MKYYSRMTGGMFPSLVSQKNLVSDLTCQKTVDMFEGSELGESSPLHYTFDSEGSTLNLTSRASWLPICGLRLGDPLAHLAGLGVEDQVAEFIMNELVKPTEHFMSDARGHDMHCLSFSIKKYCVGSFMKRHCDQPIVSDRFNENNLAALGDFMMQRPFPFYLLDSSCSLLLNDDFDGGEIYLVDNDDTDEEPTMFLEQEVGEVHGWPSSERYQHGIALVTRGVRYVFVAHFAMKYSLDSYLHLAKMMLTEEQALRIGDTNRSW